MSFKKLGFLTIGTTALMLSAPELHAGMGKGGAGAGGQGGGAAGGGAAGGGAAGGGAAGGGGDGENAGGADRIYIRGGTRYIVRGHARQRRVARYHRRYARPVRRVANYRCVLDGMPVRSVKQCRRIDRMARKGCRYDYADASGYANYVSTGHGCAPKRRAKVRVHRYDYYAPAPRYTKRYRKARRATAYRNRAYIHGGTVYGGYGSGVTIHYGPIITKQAPAY